MEKNVLLFVSVFLAVGLVAGLFLSGSVTGDAIFNRPKTCPFDSSTFSSEYIISDDIKDLYSSTTSSNPTVSNAKVLRISSGTLGQGLEYRGVNTDTMYIHHKLTNSSSSLEVYRKDGARAVYVMTIPSSTVRMPEIFYLDYGMTQVNVGLHFEHDLKELLIGPYMKVYFETDSQGRITYVGHSDSNTRTTNDLVYNGIDISAYREDILLPLGGIIVKNPALNARNDQVKFRISDTSYNRPRAL